MSALAITFIQTALHWENAEANLRMFEQKIKSIPGKTELVILPEMFTTGFSMQPEKLAEPMDGKAIQWMTDMAQKQNIILTGSLIIAENGNYYNRLIWVLPNGHIGYYDKRHLFAYGGESEHYRAGNKKLIASVNGWKICPVICYDLRFPVWTRQDPDERKHYDLLICTANWPDSRIKAWDTLLQARAIENQTYVAGVNCTGQGGNEIIYSGHSTVIDPLGNIIVKKENEEAVVTCILYKKEIEQMRKDFPFLKDADRFKL